MLVGCICKDYDIEIDGKNQKIKGEKLIGVFLPESPIWISKMMKFISRAFHSCRTKKSLLNMKLPERSNSQKKNFFVVFRFFTIFSNGR